MIQFGKQTSESEQKVYKEEDTNTILTELLKDYEGIAKKGIGHMENRSSHFNLHFHGFPESFGTLETESFLRKVLPGMLG